MELLPQRGHLSAVLSIFVSLAESTVWLLDTLNHVRNTIPRGKLPTLYIRHGGVSLDFGRASLTVISKFRHKDMVSAGSPKRVLALPALSRPTRTSF